MDMHFNRSYVPVQDVYTDVRGLQKLKIEGNQDQALQKIAQQFESLFLHEMLKSMRKANESFEEGSLFGGGDTEFYRDMYDQQLSLSLARKGTGLAKVIYEQLSRQYGEKSADVEESVERSLDTLQGIHLSLNHQSAEKQPRISATQTAEASSSVFASASEFIDAVLPHARAAASALGVNPLLLTAQAALETGWGKYMVRDQAGQSTHNFFNIKADRSWQGEKAEVSTLEYRDGIPRREQAQFRKYPDIAESFADYVRFLQSNPRYQDALAVAEDERQFAVGLQNAGYATDPEYADKILTIVEQLSARQLGSR